MSNPFSLFLDFQASIGLLPENWSADPNAQMVLGGIAGFLTIMATVGMVFVFSADCHDNLENRFDDNAFTRIGFKVSYAIAVVVFGALAVALAASLVAGTVSLIVGLFFAYKIVFVVSILLIGPFLIAIGRLKTHKSKQARTEAQSSTSISSSLR